MYKNNNNFDQLIYGDDWIDFKQFKERYENVRVEEYPNRVKKAVSSPKITIHIVTYNHNYFIRDSIEGVLSQKINVPYEIIIGDDESTDGTREICIDYAKKYPDLIRLFLHKRENNISILGKPCLIFQYIYNNFSARGDYIAICSGDDYWTDTAKIQKQYELISNKPDISQVVTPHLIRRDNITEDEFRKMMNDSSCWGTGAASSCMYINFYYKQKIPKQFCEVIAEDIFTRYLLSHVGRIGLIKDLKPVVFRIGQHNTYMRDDNEMDYQRINTKYKMLEAFNFGEYKAKYGDTYLSRIFQININKKKLYGYSRSRFLFNILYDIYNFNLFTEFIRWSINRYSFKLNSK